MTDFCACEANPWDGYAETHTQKSPAGPVRSHCIIEIYIARYLWVNVNFDYEVDERSGYALVSARNKYLAYKLGLLWQIVALLGRSVSFQAPRGAPFSRRFSIVIFACD